MSSSAVHDDNGDDQNVCIVDSLGLQLSLGSESSDDESWSLPFQARHGDIDDAGKGEEQKNRESAEYDCIVDGSVCWIKSSSIPARRQAWKKGSSEEATSENSGGTVVETVLAPRAGELTTAMQLNVVCTHGDSRSSDSCTALTHVRARCAFATLQKLKKNVTNGDHPVSRAPLFLSGMVIAIYPSLVVLNATPIPISIQTVMGIRRLAPLGAVVNDADDNDDDDWNDSAARRLASCDVVSEVSAQGEIMYARLSCDAERSWSDTFQVASTSKRLRLLCPTTTVRGAAAGVGDDEEEDHRECTGPTGA
jgi:hypothetical protein